MARDEDPPLVFLSTWYDELGAVDRQYRLKFFEADGSVEVFDVQHRRTFLKRVSCPAVKRSVLFVGGMVTVYGRTYRIVDFGDEATRRLLSSSIQETLALVGPSAYEQQGKVMDAALSAGLAVVEARMVQLGPRAVKQLGAPQQFASAPVLAMKLVGADAVDVWQSLSSLSANEVEGASSSDLFASASPESAPSDLSAVFGAGADVRETATSRGCAVCVIRPHVVMAGAAGRAIDAILGLGYEISGLRQFALDKPTAAEFLEVYETVLPEHSAVVTEMSSGPCIALEIRGEKDIVRSFRDACGPREPEAARAARPKSLRALFGEDLVKNGVHCTDLSEDGPLESEFFFGILA